MGLFNLWNTQKQSRKEEILSRTLETEGNATQAIRDLITSSENDWSGICAITDLFEEHTPPNPKAELFFNEKVIEETITLLSTALPDFISRPKYAARATQCIANLTILEARATKNKTHEDLAIAAITKFEPTTAVRALGNLGASGLYEEKVFSALKELETPITAMTIYGVATSNLERGIQPHNIQGLRTLVDLYKEHKDSAPEQSQELASFIDQLSTKFIAVTPLLENLKRPTLYGTTPDADLAKDLKNALDYANSAGIKNKSLRDEFSTALSIHKRLTSVETALQDLNQETAALAETQQAALLEKAEQEFGIDLEQGLV